MSLRPAILHRRKATPQLSSSRKAEEGVITIKYLDNITNIAVIVGVAIFAFVALRGGAHNASQSVLAPHSLKGSYVLLPGEKFPKQKDTIVMVMSTKCHFCSESLPFYKSLLEAEKGKADLVAIFPQPVVEASAFLKSAGITTPRLISLPIQGVGVFGTPTLLVLDSKGKVIAEWSGLIDVVEQKKLLSQPDALVSAS